MARLSPQQLRDIERGAVEVDQLLVDDILETLRGDMAQALHEVRGLARYTLGVDGEVSDDPRGDYIERDDALRVLGAWLS